ncbi:MAG: hypothetical protein GY810_04460 [Aureispira sp.]|nr:hypothetical protein [Aureispira sp.]
MSLLQSAYTLLIVLGLVACQGNTTENTESTTPQGQNDPEPETKTTSPLRQKYLTLKESKANLKKEQAKTSLWEIMEKKDTIIFTFYRNEEGAVKVLEYQKKYDQGENQGHQEQYIHFYLENDEVFAYWEFNIIGEAKDGDISYYMDESLLLAEGDKIVEQEMRDKKIMGSEVEGLNQNAFQSFAPMQAALDGAEVQKGINAVGYSTTEELNTRYEARAIEFDNFEEGIYEHTGKSE